MRTVKYVDKRQLDQQYNAGGQVYAPPQEPPTSKSNTKANHPVLNPVSPKHQRAQIASNTHKNADTITYPGYIEKL